MLCWFYYGLNNPTCFIKICFIKELLIKFATSAGALILEIIVGVLVVAPIVWLSLRFLPVSNLHPLCCETPLDYGATHYDTLSLKTDDGGIIAGWYVAPTTQTGKAIILIHGYGYDRRGTDFQTRALIASGYGVLLYDLRDHGESIGKINASNRMHIYQSDLVHVVNFLKQKPEINPNHIGVVGISLGAYTTLNATQETLNGFSALWLDGVRGENFFAKTAPKHLTDYMDPVFFTKPVCLPPSILETPLFRPHENLSKSFQRLLVQK